MTGEVVDELSEGFVFPATHYVTERERMLKAIISIEEELRDRLGELEGKGKMLEAWRLRMRTNYDLEMMREVGFCSGSRTTTPSRWTGAGRSALHPPRLLPQELPDHHRRVTRDRSPDRRPVRG